MINYYPNNFFILQALYIYVYVELRVIKKFNVNFSISQFSVFFLLLLLTVFDIAESLINASVPSTNNFCALSNF